MLRLAVEAGYPSLRQWLQRDGGISALEHRELVDLIAVDLVGGERVDWHFARLYAILGTLLSKATDDEGFSIKEFLLENLVLAPPDEEGDDALAERATALMTGFAARLGATVETVEMGRDDVSDDDPEDDREE